MTKRNALTKFVEKLKSYRLAHKNWSNGDNKRIYQNMPLEYFYRSAVQGGLDTGIDVKNLKQYINSVKSILEIGAGYGRVLSHILNQGYTGKLVAVERNKKFCQFLQSQFHGRAEIFCADIINFQCDEKFDLILWMWAGICEFSKTEQAKAISHLGKMLNKNGHLIVDTIPIECNSINAMELSPHNRVIETPYGKNHGYFPANDEIIRSARQVGLTYCEDLIYYTIVGRKRRLSIFCLR